jgi:hypothetical protein
MVSQSRLFLALGTLCSLALSEKVGYFESSACADPKGFTSCYKDAETEYTNCVNNNCVGGSQACYDSCGGSVTCMSKQCPSLGTDCINACECQRSAHQIDCASASCWNEVSIMIVQFQSMGFKSSIGLLLRVSRYRRRLPCDLHQSQL